MEKSYTVLFEIQIKYQPKISLLQRPQIKSSQDAFEQFLQLLGNNQFGIKEEAAVSYLNRANRYLEAISSLQEEYLKQ